MIPATNFERFNHLIGLARQCEKAGGCGYTFKQLKYLQLATCYREMAFAAMPSATGPDALELTFRERNALTDKLRRMTVENGCTEAEADTALQMLIRIEEHQRPRRDRLPLAPKCRPAASVIRKAARLDPAPPDEWIGVSPRKKEKVRVVPDTISQSDAQAAPRILGIDPGLTGGIALLIGDKLEGCWDIPIAGSEINPDELISIIRNAKPSMAVIERASSRPRQGVTSIFGYGQAYGTLRTAVAVCAIPQRLVTPASWKKHFNLRADKEQSRALAIKLWPGTGFFNRKSDHGRAEAALIALYGFQTFVR